MRLFAKEQAERGGPNFAEGKPLVHAVYVAPLEALVAEKYAEWTEKLGKTMGIKVAKLTGMRGCHGCSSCIVSSAVVLSCRPMSADISTAVTKHSVFGGLPSVCDYTNKLVSGQVCGNIVQAVFLSCAAAALFAVLQVTPQVTCVC